MSIILIEINLVCSAYTQELLYHNLQVLTYNTLNSGSPRVIY